MSKNLYSWFSSNILIKLWVFILSIVIFLSTSYSLYFIIKTINRLKLLKQDFYNRPEVLGIINDYISFSTNYLYVRIFISIIFFLIVSLIFTDIRKDDRIKDRYKLTIRELFSLFK